MSRRVTVSIAGGLAAALLSELQAALPHPGISDFADLWHGLIAWQAGADPYAAVHALRPEVSLFYPFTALVLCWPLAFVPLHHAAALFAGVGVGAFVAAFWGRPAVFAVLSAAVFSNVIQGQWSPLLTSAAAVPWLGLVWAAKPSLGLALALAYPSRQAILGAVALTVLAFLVWPGWMGPWLAGLGRSIHVAPIRRPGGFLLLAALIRWRRPEARLIAALACIPHMAALYDAVPLFLACRTRWQAYGLAALTQVAAVLCRLATTPDMSLVAVSTRCWPIILVLVYLPALVLVLIAPNEGPSPLEDGGAPPRGTAASS